MPTKSDYHCVRYCNWLTAGTLNSYLAEVELQAQLLFDNIVKQLSEKENVNENLKASNPMK